MAWEAERKRLRWYCICGFRAIEWYSAKIRKEWWESLPEEERQEIIRRREDKERIEAAKRRRELEGALEVAATVARICLKSQHF